MSTLKMPSLDNLPWANPLVSPSKIDVVTQHMFHTVLGPGISQALPRTRLFASLTFSSSSERFPGGDSAPKTLSPLEVEHFCSFHAWLRGQFEHCLVRCLAWLWMDPRHLNKKQQQQQ